MDTGLMPTTQPTHHQDQRGIMASTTTAKRFHHDLRSLADGYGVLCLIAERKASVMARHPATARGAWRRSR